jgi:hypothetical protein
MEDTIPRMDLNGETDLASQITSINLEESGVIAQLFKAQDKISIFTKDGSELFSFGASACPFQAEPIKFLVDIYKIGFDRGKLIGKEVTKMRLREVFASELL